MKLSEEDQTLETSYQILLIEFIQIINIAITSKLNQIQGNIYFADNYEHYCTGMNVISYTRTCIVMV